MTYHARTAEAARGKWRGILMSIGLPSQVLQNKHGPCPLCGGKDRFRWDNQEGTGSYICSGCGAGDGIALAMGFTKKPFVEMASEIDSLLGNHKFEPDKVQQKITGDDTRRLLRALWAETSPMERGDIADKYLASRCVNQFTYPRSLRFGANVRDGEGGTHPCMVATVSLNGKPVTLHRTFLRRDGSGKAEGPAPRKMMPGAIPDGACVELSEYTGGPLGIAEGIETALSASAMFDVPVWAALNTSLMKKWKPPEGCEEVIIFGDHDRKLGGHAAAYTLAHRLAMGSYEVKVQIPDAVGDDWNDEWVRWRRDHG